MQQVTIHAAKTNLSKLIQAVLNGEEVVIAKGNKPLVRLVPVGQPAFQIGLLQGQLGSCPEFLEPMGETDLDVWEFGEA